MPYWTTDENTVDMAAGEVQHKRTYRVKATPLAGKERFSLMCRCDKNAPQSIIDEDFERMVRTMLSQAGYPEGTEVTRES